MDVSKVQETIRHLSSPFFNSRAEDRDTFPGPPIVDKRRIPLTTFSDVTIALLINVQPKPPKGKIR
jgi:hypothetical protein